MFKSVIFYLKDWKNAVYFTFFHLSDFYQLFIYKDFLYKAHNSLLLFLRDPEKMKTYLSDNEVVLSENKKRGFFRMLPNWNKRKLFLPETGY